MQKDNYFLLLSLYYLLPKVPIIHFLKSQKMKANFCFIFANLQWFELFKPVTVASPVSPSPGLPLLLSCQKLKWNKYEVSGTPVLKSFQNSELSGETPYLGSPRALLFQLPALPLGSLWSHDEASLLCKVPRCPIFLGNALWLLFLFYLYFIYVRS